MWKFYFNCGFLKQIKSTAGILGIKSQNCPELVFDNNKTNSENDISTQNQLLSKSIIFDKSQKLISNCEDLTISQNIIK